MQVRVMVRIVLISMFLTVLFSLLSQVVLQETGYLIAIILVIAFIAIACLFDMIAVAALSCEEKPFHSMAARKGKGAKEALWLIRNADQVATVLSDVVGDVLGIISGAVMAVLAVRLVDDFRISALLINLLITALVVGMTIGAKAYAKSISIRNSRKILHITALILCRLHLIKEKK